MKNINEKDEIEACNYALVTDMAMKLNLLKRYEAGYSNPRKGKMIVNKDGVNYIIEITPILEDLSFEEAIKTHSYLFR